MVRRGTNWSKQAAAWGYSSGSTAKRAWEETKRQEKAFNQALYREAKKLEKATGMSRKDLEDLGLIPRRQAIKRKDVVDAKTMHEYRKALRKMNREIKTGKIIKDAIRKHLEEDDMTPDEAEEAEDMVREMTDEDLAEFFKDFDWKRYKKLKDSLRAMESMGTLTFHDLDYFQTKLEEFGKDAPDELVTKSINKEKSYLQRLRETMKKSRMRR